ncbi:MAG: TonB family protein [Bacteroidetes bacterium]|nr:MAG: TonB family protein [Bacteroidota bacterium]
MEPFINFMIRASVYLLIFSAGYALLKGNQLHVRYQRIFILTSFAISLLLASVGIIPLNIPVVTESQGVIRSLPEFIVVAQSGIMESGNQLFMMVNSISWWHLLPIVVFMLLFVRLCVRLFHIYRMIQNHPVEKNGEVSLVIMSNDVSPFSFLRWIFIPEHIRGSHHFDKVIMHEQAHYRLRHSWDVIFIEIMRLLFWFHPSWYFFRNELQSLHEFEADSFVLRKFKVTDYQRALLDCALGAYYIPVTNPFNVLMIKKRFMMMTKNHTQKAGPWLIKTILLVPFLVAAFMIQSCDIGDKPAETEATVSDVEEIKQYEAPEYSGKIYDNVDQDPEFIGGQSELMKYLQSNLTYPTQARTDSVQGTVFVTFVVEKDGKINDVKILRGVSNELDTVSLRVVKAMPDWKPGYQEGEPVRVQYNLPIRFVLN